MKSNLERALDNAKAPAPPPSGVEFLINHFHGAWKTNLAAAANGTLKNIPTLMVNTYSRILVIGLMLSILENGYKAEVMRDLKLTTEEFDRILDGLTLLRDKLINMKPAESSKSLTKTFYDRIRQIGR
jgi:hypothetical protein